MTADFLRPDKLATSGNLTAHGTHGTSGDYLVEIADFVSKGKIKYNLLQVISRS